MTATSEAITGPFYHGTKAALQPGDLITPGYRSNYAHGQRTSRWVYMSAILSPWAAELAQGDGPGRIYVVEPTGPFEDDPDLTDKRFAGNPTRSYRSRSPLRVVGEVTDWQGHTADELQAMKDALERHRVAQAARLGSIPNATELARLHAEADAAAREWADDAAYRSCTLLMRIRGVDVNLYASLAYDSAHRAETCHVELPQSTDDQLQAWPSDMRLSGRIADVSAWRESWIAVIESCITEIGLSVETRIWIAVDAASNALRFQVDADGPERSWQRRIDLANGVLIDAAWGEIWDFASHVD